MLSTTLIIGGLVFLVWNRKIGEYIYLRQTKLFDKAVGRSVNLKSGKLLSAYGGGVIILGVVFVLAAYFAHFGPIYL